MLILTTCFADQYTFWIVDIRIILGDFFLTAYPLAEITIEVTDDTGTMQDRQAGTIMVENAVTELYHLEFGDTVTFRCENVRGDESVILTNPNNMMIMSDTYTIPNITVESFVNGIYRCNLNDPTFPQCPPSTDLVVVNLVGELSCECCLKAFL